VTDVNATSGIQVQAYATSVLTTLRKGLTKLETDHEARCLVVRSAGSHFCAGADLKERRGMTLDQVRDFVPQVLGVIDPPIQALPRQDAQFDFRHIQPTPMLGGIVKF
jgi:enoyl-CoA hydratase/carnithine racemase